MWTFAKLQGALQVIPKLLWLILLVKLWLTLFAPVCTKLVEFYSLLPWKLSRKKWLLWQMMTHEKNHYCAQVAPSGYSDKKYIHQNGLRGRLVPYWDYQKTMVTNSKPQGIPQKSGWQVPVEQLSQGSFGSHFKANFIKR